MIVLNRSNLQLLALLNLTIFLNGCAVHYYDKNTETEHIWGIGHMKMKASSNNEGVRALITGTETFGLALGNGPDYQGAYLSVGWQQVNGLMVVEEDTNLRLEWPSTDLFNIRVGTEFPYGILNPSNGVNNNGDNSHE